ncbi:aminodeoxychorismate lyase [Cobetia sp. L2A1]|uniref:aminodeoxychorismate lyase n=1 Tax=Cobetia sp. L2A1 TaxID=2686360 RepID=UPI00131ECF6B|nr:aminodeoxychorismate lyase [Cobetia sp. L2A1]
MTNMNDVAGLDAALPADDRGLAYGEGVFETILVRDGAPLLWSHHLARLTQGCERLGLVVPSITALESCLGVCGGQGLEVLKIIVTGGSGGRGYKAPASPEPRLRARSMPFAVNHQARRGITARMCSLRVAEQPALAGLKHLNRLENVLARREWTDPAISEGVLLNARDELVEATSMNLLWYRDGRWYTPWLDRAGVEGTLLTALSAEQPIEKVRLGIEALLAAEQVVLLNSVQGIWPVTRLLDSGGECLGDWQPSDFPALEMLNKRVACLLGEHAD